jgi:DNA-binding HxlR family transcriptional regulator
MGRYQAKRPPLDPCPVEHVVTLVGGKWKARLLYRLSLGDASLGDLQRHLPRARPQVLTAQLQAMAADGLVRRRAAGADHAWGRFEITERGRSLCAAIDAVASWGAIDIGGWVPPVFPDIGTPAPSGRRPIHDENAPAVPVAHVPRGRHQAGDFGLMSSRLNTVTNMERRRTKP